MITKEITEEEVTKYYKENYHNGKRSTGVNINKQLWIDLQLLCLKLSRKSKFKITASKKIRDFIVKEIMKDERKI